MRLPNLFSLVLFLCTVLAAGTALAGLSGDLDAAKAALNSAKEPAEIQKAMDSFQSVANGLSGRELDNAEKGLMRSALMGIAMTNIRLARPKEAVTALEKALGMADNNTDTIRGLLAYGYAALGDMAKAQEQAKACNMADWQVQNLTAATNPSEVAKAYVEACEAEKAKSMGGAVQGADGGGGPAVAPKPVAEALDMVALARAPEADLGGVAPAGPAAPGAPDIAPRQEQGSVPGGPLPSENVGPLPGVVQQDGETLVGGRWGFAGKADTFGLDHLAREEFSLREFAGYYQVQGQPDRYLVVVDALATQGRLLLLDQETGFLRSLKSQNPMVYSYGYPGCGDEPVQGVMYLMPRKERYANENINLPHQVVWMGDEPPALVAQMVRIREKEFVVRSRGRELKGMAAMPMGPGPFPGVVWLPGGCEPAAVREGFARTLAVRGLAAVVFDYPGCEAAAGETSRVSLDDLAQDAAAALAQLRREEGVDPAQCGLWGRDKGIWPALRAAARARAGEAPGFVVCAVTAGSGEPLPLPEADSAAADMPQLWLLSAPQPEQAWGPCCRFLDDLAQQGRSVETTLHAEEPAAPGDEAAALSRQLMPWHAELGSRWVMERK